MVSVDTTPYTAAESLLPQVQQQHAFIAACNMLLYDWSCCPPPQETTEYAFSNQATVGIINDARKLQPKKPLHSFRQHLTHTCSFQEASAALAAAGSPCLQTCQHSVSKTPH